MSAVLAGTILSLCEPTLAGGLGVREQSTSAQGASFAGAAAGGDLSSSFWNPAAMSSAGPGLATESHFSLLSTDIGVRAKSVSVLPGSALGPSTTLVDDHTDLDQLVLVGSSYGAWRLDKDLVLGMAINAPFGSKNKAHDATWSGEYHFRSSELLTVNINPIVSYRIADGLFIGAGPQVQYLALTIKANPSGGLAPPQASSVLDGDDVGVGFTAGVLWQPGPMTSIGLGFRSSVAHTIQGDASMAGGFLTTAGGTAPFEKVDFEAKLRTPETATLSLRQGLSDTTRLLATVEWSNWSRLDKVDFIATSKGGLAAQPVLLGQTVSILDFHWDDGWFLALGAEWDYSSTLTVRAGAAYEMSPIRHPEQRKINVADSDRIWLSIGATYALTAVTAVDLAYTHIFFDDAPIDSLTTTPSSATTPVRRFTGAADQAADIVSVSLKTKW